MKFMNFKSSQRHIYTVHTFYSFVRICVRIFNGSVDYMWGLGGLGKTLPPPLHWKTYDENKFELRTLKWVSYTDWSRNSSYTTWLTGLQLAWGLTHQNSRVLADCNLTCLTISNDTDEWVWKSALGVRGWMCQWERQVIRKSSTTWWHLDTHTVLAEARWELTEQERWDHLRESTCWRVRKLVCRQTGGGGIKAEV